MVKKLTDISKKIKPNKVQKYNIVDYVNYRKDIKKTGEDIQHLKEKGYLNNKDRIDTLKKHKRETETLLMKIEESFYDSNKGLWLGVAVDLESDEMNPILLYLPWAKLYNHFVVYGTSGYGKTRLYAIILRQIINFGWNVFAVDPKGGEKQEIAKWLYEFAIKEGKNNKVMRIMAAYPDLSDKINPIFGMSDEEIANMSYSLVSTGVGVEASSEKYFSGQVFRISMGILSAITFLEKVAYYNNEAELLKEVEKEAIKYMQFKEMSNLEVDYEDENIIFPDIVKISLHDLTKEKNKSFGISPYNRILISFKELAYFGQYKHLEELRDLVKEFPLPKIKDRGMLKKIKELQYNAISSVEPLINMGEDHYNKVGDTYSVMMGQLAFGSIGKIFTSTRINPLRFKLKKDSVITLFEPAPLKFEKVSEMMIKVFIKMFISIFGEVGATGRKMNNRVALLVDEAKPMVFPGIEELYNKARDLGMTIGAFYQSKSDSKLKLGETLADIIDDNTATQIFMKQVSFSSQEEIAKTFGTKKIAVNINMGEIDSIDGRNVVSYEERNIVNPTDIDKLDIGSAYIRHYGKKYFVKFPYQSDPDDTIEIDMPELESENIFSELEKINEKIRKRVNESKL